MGPYSAHISPIQPFIYFPQPPAHGHSPRYPPQPGPQAAPLQTPLQPPVSHPDFSPHPRLEALPQEHPIPHTTPGSVSAVSGSPYVPVNPFRPPTTRPQVRPLDEEAAPAASDAPEALSKADISERVYSFVFRRVPQEIYLHFLLRLPALYWSRVSRIFREAELGTQEIKQSTLATLRKQKDRSRYIVYPHELTHDPRSPFGHLKTSWEGFINSLMREWKTLNLVSVLLLSSVDTILLFPSATHPLLWK